MPLKSPGEAKRLARPARARRLNGRSRHPIPPPERLPAARPRRGVPAGRPGRGHDAGGHGPLGGLGPAPLRHLHGGLGLLGPEGGPGDGGGHPDLDPHDRPRPHLPPPLDAARERDRHRDRRRLGLARRGRHLHPARPLHPEARPPPRADRLHLPRRRLPRRALPHPPPPLLRARDARAVPLPRGHRDHRGPGHRREGRLAGEAAAPGHRDRRRLRLPRHHLPRVARVRGLPVRPRREVARRAGEGGRELRRRGLHPRPRLRHGPPLLAHPLRGRLPRELRPRAPHLDDREPPARRRRLPRGDPHRRR